MVLILSFLSQNFSKGNFQKKEGMELEYETFSYKKVSTNSLIQSICFEQSRTFDLRNANLAPSASQALLCPAQHPGRLLVSTGEEVKKLHMTPKVLNSVRKKSRHFADL